MKNQSKNLSAFQKLMVVFIPVIVMLLIASIVMCLAFSFLPMPINSIIQTGNVTIVMALSATILAILAIVFAFVSKDIESKEDKTE